MERTLELAKAFSSKVWILHVVPRLQEPPFNIDRDTLRQEVETERHREHQLLLHMAQSLADHDIDAEAFLVEGKIVSTILNQSDRLDIDLIVLGCHKHSLLFGALMDVTEESLLSKCARPIMIIPVAK